MRRCTDNKRASTGILLLHHPPTSTATTASIHLWIYSLRIAPFIVCISDVKLQLSYLRMNPIQMSSLIATPHPLFDKGAICEAQVGVCSLIQRMVYDDIKQPPDAGIHFHSSPHEQTADETDASLEGQNAEWRKKKNERLQSTPTFTAPLLLLLFSPLLLPLPPLSTSLLTLQRGNYLKYISSHSLARAFSCGSGVLVDSSSAVKVLLTV